MPTSHEYQALEIPVLRRSREHSRRHVSALTELSSLRTRQSAQSGTLSTDCDGATRCHKEPQKATRGHEKQQKATESHKNKRRPETVGDRKPQKATTGNSWRQKATVRDNSRQEERSVLRWLDGYWNIKECGY